MTKPKDLRDEFALASLPQCAGAVFDDERRGMNHFTKEGDPMKSPVVMATMAYEIADAMMAEREKTA